MASRTTSSRKRTSRAQLPVRALVAVGLLAFVAVTSVVVWRRSIGVSTGRAMQRLRDERRLLEADRVTLETQWRRATSRAEVVREAERRLGMHVATEMEAKSLVVPSAAPAAESAAVPPGATP